MTNDDRLRLEAAIAAIRREAASHGASRAEIEKLIDQIKGQFAEAADKSDEPKQPERAIT